jgi:hypothetical protein
MPWWHLGCALRNDATWRMRIGGICTPDAAYDVALPPMPVTFVECEAVGDILNCIPVEIDFELIHALRMPAGYRDRAESGVADIDDEHAARLTSEHLQIRDIEANVLSRDG